MVARPTSMSLSRFSFGSLFIGAEGFPVAALDHKRHKRFSRRQRIRGIQLRLDGALAQAYSLSFAFIEPLGEVGMSGDRLWKIRRCVCPASGP